MASGSTQRIALRDWLELELPDGALVKVRPGPYGKGLSVVPLAERRRGAVNGVTGGAKRGRKPRASTVKLRKRLKKDADAEKLRTAKEYVKWLLSIDDTVSLAVARQVVYRERKPYAD